MSSPKIWVESFWLTHKESVTLGDHETGDAITRDISVGMTVKSDKSARSDAMYEALRKALNRIVEEEKEQWLESHKMKLEVAKLRGEVAEIEDVDPEVVIDEESGEGEVPEPEKAGVK